ncbi:hypothetical protein HPB51_000502 [Rhipicephalus microplus]|uniref:BSD domain-containing protein n=1 Tax=Rhipicephalus microplus TaxID=6941 RepID=A0A9J6E5R6_RHIMP|nr:hypothetical protein HPB51_000502 [Rhipicephalus microplus]
MEIEEHVHSKSHITVILILLVYNRQFKSLALKKLRTALAMTSLDDIPEWCPPSLVCNLPKDEIADILLNYSEVQRLYDELVPGAVPHEEFWQRYFFRAFQLWQAEEELLNSVQESSERLSISGVDSDHLMETLVGPGCRFLGSRPLVVPPNTPNAPSAEQSGSNSPQPAKAVSSPAGDAGCDVLGTLTPEEGGQDQDIERTLPSCSLKGSAIEACDEDELPVEEIAVAWADLQESDVPADVDLNEFLQADSDLVVCEEITEEDIIKWVQEESALSDEDKITTQCDSMIPSTSLMLDTFDIIRRCIGAQDDDEAMALLGACEIRVVPSLGKKRKQAKLTKLWN